MNVGQGEKRNRFARHPWISSLIVLGFGVAAWGAFKSFHATHPAASASNGKASTRTAATGDYSEQIRTFCSACHVFPPATSFPRQAWREEVEKAFEFAKTAKMDPDTYPPLEEVVRYFEERAPLNLQLLTRPQLVPGSEKLQFRKRSFGVAGLPLLPGVSNVKWACLTDPVKPDCLACDMRHGYVLLWRHDQPDRGLEPIAKLWNPAHVEVVDLDQDGWPDLLVADLGSFLPTDDRTGRVIWLRRIPRSDYYKPYILAENLGRVADVQAADFDSDGNLDLVVAVFGYHTAGQILYLENHTTDWSRPDFRPITLEERTGAIHVPVADLNGDGRPDFVALFSQEHEQIVAYLNEGGGKFRRELIYAAPDPAYGSSGIQLVDLDGDGDIDVLYTNGDTLDSQYIKPYHGIQWLENEGSFPFRHHPIATLPGVHRAVAVDMDGDGDLDIVAVTFLSNVRFPQRKQLRLDSVVWLEQVEPGRFELHTLEQVSCDHVTVDVADFNGDGRPDLVIGNLTLDGIDGPATLPPLGGWITIWENLGVSARNGGSRGPKAAPR